MIIFTFSDMKKSVFYLLILMFSLGFGLHVDLVAQQTTAVLKYEGGDYEISSSFSAPMTITYKGDTSMKSYVVSVKTGSFQTTYSGYSLSGLKPDVPMSIKVPVSFWKDLEPGNHDFSCWVSKVNGSDAQTASSDTLRFEIIKIDESSLSIRKVLFEGFSSAYCPYCPAFNEKMKPVLEELGDKVVAVKYHVSKTQDPYWTSYGNKIYNSYGFTGIPAGAVDGVKCTKDGEVAALRAAVSSAGKSFLSLVKDTLYITEDKQLHVSIDVKSVVEESGMTVKAYVLEKVMDQQYGSNGEREFPHLFITDVPFNNGGTGLSVSSDKSLRMEGSVDMGSTFMEESYDLEVVMIVTDASNKILQTERFDVFSTEEPEESYILPDKTNFPDSVFRAYVAKEVDKDADGKLQESELASFTEMNVSDMGIYSLEGISHFKNLTSLDCSSNHLMWLDLTANTTITDLKCSGQTQTVDLEGGNTFDLSTVSGLDVKKIGNVKNATLDGTVMKFNANEVTYEYACGLGENIMEVTLTASRFTSNQKVPGQAGFSVFVDGRDIRVVFEDATQKMVEVYDLRGVQIYRGMQDRISVMNPGIYLVRVGSSVKKVAVL